MNDKNTLSTGNVPNFRVFQKEKGGRQSARAHSSQTRYLLDIRMNVLETKMLFISYLKIPCTYSMYAKNGIYQYGSMYRGTKALKNWCALKVYI